MKLLHQFEGCLLDGAVGDALGAPIDVMARGEMTQRYLQHGVQAECMGLITTLGFCVGVNGIGTCLGREC